MARPDPQIRRATSAAAPAEPAGSLHLSPRNLLLLAAALATIVIGYILLAGGSTVAAPLLLVLGYAVLFPLGILL